IFFTASEAWLLKRSLTGQAGVVSSMSKLTFPESMAMFLIKPRDTMSWWRSGSWILRRAFKTSCSVKLMKKSSFGRLRLITSIFADENARRLFLFPPNLPGARREGILPRRGENRKVLFSRENQL